MIGVVTRIVDRSTSSGNVKVVPTAIVLIGASSFSGSVNI